ncbi:cellulase family glycosylhydrolase [Streptomyces sp. NPDC048551]|uniref:cellulase family glycosylhydrolase n=1 Tax=Streptomyces sp. NPDC048551 TaxID=3155758 RepID=UPI0034432FBE
MNRRFTAVAVGLATVAGSVLMAAPSGQAAEATTGFHVSNGRLQDANNQDVVLRGINHAHTWYPNRTATALHDIKATGANSVRVVLATGDQWTRTTATEVAGIISQCKANRLVCVLEAHDTTGYGEQSAAVSLSRAVDYWIGIKDALQSQEKYAILNIGNEPYGNSGYSAWTADTKAAIQRLRTAGFTHTLMVDAPNWGQDWSFTMRDNAAGVFAADPQRNTVFSIHMYGVFDTAPEIDDYLGRFVNAKLPILVGEFGDNHSDGNPDEAAIMATTQRLGLGYLGWSWSGNGSGVEYLDIATGFDATQLSAWGRRLIDGADGIRSTSREVSVYGGTGGGDTRAPSAPGAPAASAVTASGARLSWSASTDDVGVTAYDVVRVGAAGETPVTTVGATGADLTGLAAETRYDFAVYARDAAGNRSARSAVVTVTTGRGGTTPTGSCAVTYRISDWGSSFNGDVTIKNTGTTPVNGWQLAFTFPANRHVTQMWNANPTQNGKQVTATDPATYNTTIDPGATVNFGFSATSTPGTNTAPATFTLNGAMCATR